MDPRGGKGSYYLSVIVGYFLWPVVFSYVYVYNRRECNLKDECSLSQTTSICNDILLLKWRKTPYTLVTNISSTQFQSSALCN